MKSVEEKSWLVFSGGNDRAIFAFLRALRLCGERVHIVARTNDDRILRSTFRHDVAWVRPTHDLSLGVISECIDRVRAKAGPRKLVVLPSTEFLNTFLLRHRPKIEGMGCEIPLVDASLYMQLTQKRSASEFFSAAGLSAPREIDLSAALNQPVVAKPYRNVSASGESLYPHLLYNRTALESFLRRHDANDYFFQEFVSGESHYLLFHLSQEQGPDFIWSQRNLIQQPGGKSMLLAEPSTFHESETALRITQALRHAGFHGLGMVEIIRTPERDLFIEMNPRIWGPLQFCLDQGQVLPQAFIGDILHGDPARHIHRRPRSRRKRYFWLGGLLETLSTDMKPTWHTTMRSISLTIARNLACDVYLRKDSWRCFIHDLWQSLEGRAHR
ncbi:MAG: hypothetical protein EON59_04140 [Alphaproteobacteria bacterium]|nr:MAG: hypothetical protein EON59_04140 [Alphaproteobacteria bacterium]